MLHANHIKMIEYARYLGDILMFLLLEMTGLANTITLKKKVLMLFTSHMVLMWMKERNYIVIPVVFLNYSPNSNKSSTVTRVMLFDDAFSIFWWNKRQLSVLCHTYHIFKTDCFKNKSKIRKETLWVHYFLCGFFVPENFIEAFLLK